MKCPHCGSFQTRVIDSRQYVTFRHRKYRCMDCDKKFTTTEKVVQEEKEANKDADRADR